MLWLIQPYLRSPFFAWAQTRPEMSCLFSVQIGGPIQVNSHKNINPARVWLTRVNSCHCLEELRIAELNLWYENVCNSLLLVHGRITPIRQWGIAWSRFHLLPVIKQDLLHAGAKCHCDIAHPHGCWESPLALPGLAHPCLCYLEMAISAAGHFSQYDMLSTDCLCFTFRPYINAFWCFFFFFLCSVIFT